MQTILRFSICSYFIFGLISCSAQNKKEESYKDFPLEVTSDYKKAWSEEQKYRGRVYYYVLKEPKIVQSYPIEGKFKVNSEGKLIHFTLAKAYSINGTIIPKGSAFNRYFEDYYTIDLPKDTIIQGYPAYHKEDGVIFYETNPVEFLNDGTLRSLGLSKNVVIQDIPCYGDRKNRSVIFYNNGKLRHCRLAENKIIQDYPCYGGEKNSPIWFLHTGEILSFILSKDFEINGQLYPEGTQIIFDTNRNVHCLSGHLKLLQFHENGNISRVITKDEVEVNNILFPGYSMMWFNKTGSLKSARSRKNLMIHHLPCKKWKHIGFHPNGKIKKCTLSDDIELNGVVYNKGSKLHIDEEGKVLK